MDHFRQHLEIRVGHNTVAVNVQDIIRPRDGSQMAVVEELHEEAPKQPFGQWLGAKSTEIAHDMLHLGSRVPPVPAEPLALQCTRHRGSRRVRWRQQAIDGRASREIGEVIGETVLRLEDGVWRAGVRNPPFHCGVKHEAEAPCVPTSLLLAHGCPAKGLLAHGHGRMACQTSLRGPMDAVCQGLRQRAEEPEAINLRNPDVPALLRRQEHALRAQVQVAEAQTFSSMDGRATFAREVRNLLR
mmetsp:Transcript_81029/g.234326  ORF Transcript_81029/g.234326 Transcript_81029/m.234326 type:complete len:243 (+) Transcript_81029:132-860(+)